MANGGLNAVVLALAASGSDLYVGGQFTQSADGVVPNLNHIARYSAPAWAALADGGLNADVKALVAASGGDLYAGGDFVRSSGDAQSMLDHIVRLGGGGWSALANNGVNDTVRALAVSGTGLYVGGDFIQTADGAVRERTASPDSIVAPRSPPRRLPPRPRRRQLPLGARRVRPCRASAIAMVVAT